ncbi:hypothetical protein [Mesorhizobium sp. LNJC391B00]|uniref:hypothetical protein n=1 Tax=Mesorhizobium sp. LNJC391B00 TaxID=1287273 RepID=UPI0003CF6FCA|nr:hypothetical protein [Mesorhizobium sp. LNJC391B00]ESY16134.1 hypothetical protein X749_31775 [Mesorhizobium sp. LNJC391B00]
MVRNIRSCFFSFVSVIAFALAFVLAPAYGIAFDPAAEIALQSALIQPSDCSECARLNKAIRTAEVRSSLEDTARLQYELG